ncbi:hypothetical protein [Bradyrhizobium sp. F1.13.3]|uniref:hypothetical protein n=1 Tax=Bradyrhizobium sp. F1.13.3 TaxID=3156351 RepID=UPI003394638B
MPSLNPTIATAFGHGFVPLSRRQVLDVAITSLNTIGLAVVGDKEAFVRTVLYRLVANTRSMELVGQVMRGKKIVEGQRASRSLTRRSTARPYLAVRLGEDVGRRFGGRSVRAQ